MKKFGLLIIVLYLSVFANLNSQLYVGGGINYALPQSEFSDNNKDAIGINLQIDYRQYCKLWLGLRIDYTDFEPLTDTTVFYYSNITMLSPQIKYAPFTEGCYDNKFIPYLVGQLNISSISGTDNLSKIGLGAGMGIGFAYNFKIFDKCWMIELNSIYTYPNTIERAKDRSSISLINSAITLSVGL